MRDRNEIPTAIPMFLMLSNPSGLILTLSFVGVSGKLQMAANYRWRPGTGSAYEITCSAAMRNSNKITTAMPKFFRSSNMTALARILSYVRVSGISKMAGCNRKWIYTTNLPQIVTWWNSIRISPVMMLDAKNISIYVGNSLRSCIQAEIRYFRTTSVYRPTSSIAHSPRHTVVFRSFQLFCLTSET